MIHTVHELGEYDIYMNIQYEYVCVGVCVCVMIFTYLN